MNLQLVKVRKGKKHTFVFSYREGCEKDLIEALRSNVIRGMLDWFDIALLYSQAGKPLPPEFLEKSKAINSKDKTKL